MDVEMTKKIAFDYDTVMFEQTKDGRGRYWADGFAIERLGTR